MKTKRYIISISGLLLLIFLLAGCGAEKTEVDTQEQVFSVRSKLVEPSSIDLIDTYTGTLYGVKQAVLYSKISESINKIYVDENNQVTAGTILLKFDSTGPGSGYLQAKSLFENARKNFKKMEYLYKEGAVSETEYDAAKTEFEVRNAAYVAASQMINIETPIDGLVTDVNVSAGDFVSVGTELATVAQTDVIRAKFEVSADKIASLKKGAPVFIEDERSRTKMNGTINSVARSSDPVTRTFMVEALFDNRENVLQPGTFVRIRFVSQALTDVLIIPRKAVILLEDKPVVYVVKDNLAILRHIELGEASNGNVVINSGLMANDTLITVGQEYIEDSSKVNITAWEE